MAYSGLRIRGAIYKMPPLTEEQKQKARENNKQYREANKEKIQEKKRIDRQRKKTCECGCEVFARHYARHRRTIKHERLMNAS